VNASKGFKHYASEIVAHMANIEAPLFVYPIFNLEEPNNGKILLDRI